MKTIELEKIEELALRELLAYEMKTLGDKKYDSGASDRIANKFYESLLMKLEDKAA